MPSIIAEHSYSCQCSVIHRVFLCSAAPIAALNTLFPDGVPVSASYPTLDLGGYECFELFNFQSLPFPKQVDLMEILFSEGVPTAIGRAYLVYQTVAIPAEWAEVI